jgi:hypothetical protein
MKRFLTLSIAVLFTICTFTQAPQKMSYQAVIRNSSDQLVKSQAIGMKISILQGSETGTPVYVETQTSSTNTNGLVIIQIGEGTPVTGTFSSINWTSGPYFIKTETDPSGGTTYSITGTSQILSVPFAFFAKTAGNSINGNALGDIQYWNGTSWVLLPRGSTGQVLSINSSNIPSWQNAASISLLPPTAVTKTATNVYQFSSTFNGTINPMGLMTSARFEYGLTTAYGDDADIEDTYYGSTDINISMSIPPDSYSDFLIPGTTYHYRIVADNPVNVTYGNDMTFTTPATSVNIGQSYLGGKVAYILRPGDPGYILGETHGLIVPGSDQSTGIQWYNGSNITTGATGEGIGTGNSNTNSIVVAQGAGSYAAKICYDLVTGGYSDWYLPSLVELHKILSNKASIGGFTSDIYWSSTELVSSQALGADSDYMTSYSDKNLTLRVRAVRSF